MAKQWIDIDKEKQLAAGDEIRLHFTVTGFTYLTAAQVALIERDLEKEPRFTVLRHSIPDSKEFNQLNSLTMDIKVNSKQPYGATGEWLRSDLVVTGTITAAIIAKIVLASVIAYVVYMGLSKVEQLTEGVEAVGWTSVQIAAALIAVYLVYKYA